METIIDYYSTLRLPYGAEKSAITAAYRRLCKIYHPDINPDPQAAEMMKSINLAYSKLCAGKTEMPHVRIRRPAAQAADAEGARRCIEDYFSALLNKNYRAAYYLLSAYDRRFVTLQSFTKWREAVSKLFDMREFSVSSSGGVFMRHMDGAADCPAASHVISISEMNTYLAAPDSYRAVKLAIFEQGQWRVFLGYRDLSEIAKMFEEMSCAREDEIKSRHWEEYCKITCRDLKMANLDGFIKSSDAELYRYKRYRQQMTIACFMLPQSLSKPSAQTIEKAAETIRASLRETDIPAYLGDGCFAVLFVELRKKHAGIITKRLAQKLALLCPGAKCRFEPYAGGDIGAYITRLCEDKR